MHLPLSINIKRIVSPAIPVLFWIAIWQIISMVIAQEILLVSPWAVTIRICELVVTTDFWSSIATSLSHIILGFILSLACGIICAILGSKFNCIRKLLAPLMQTIKSVPVASFIILVLIWVSSKNLSIVISFLMVFPIVYSNVLKGICQIDKELLEMAKVFKLTPLAKFRYIYTSQVLPYLQIACSLGLGMCWKAGVAAEVIGLPKNTIGEHLYDAKIYLNTEDLFAWTVVIVVISIVIEKLFVSGLNGIVKRIENIF